MHRSLIVRSVSSAALATLLLAGIASAVDVVPHTLDPRFAPSLARYSVSSHGEIGRFPGRLVWVACNQLSAPSGIESCTATGYRHALAFNDGASIIAVVPGSEAVRQEITIAEADGDAVILHGKYYPTTGVLFVSWIETPGVTSAAAGRGPGR
jgi:hypothetical protein